MRFKGISVCFRGVSAGVLLYRRIGDCKFFTRLLKVGKIFPVTHKKRRALHPPKLAA